MKCSRLRALLSTSLQRRIAGRMQEQAPIQAMIPEEVLAVVFSKMPPHALAAAACVCAAWRQTADTPSLWRAACLRAFSSTSLEANLHLLKKHHQ